MKAFVERQLRGVKSWRCSSEVSGATSEEEVVRESDTMTRCHLVDFVFAIAVEGGPFDLCWCGFVCRGPIEDDALTGSASVADCQLAALVRRRKRDDEAADLVSTPRCIDVRLELAVWSAVDVELVKLSLRY